MSLAFGITSLVIVATPGTGALFTITAGIARGRRASLVAAAGCTLGSSRTLLRRSPAPLHCCTPAASPSRS